VWVNGQVVFDNNAPTAVLSGRPLRRSAAQR
jgi:hypothetical protein